MTQQYRYFVFDNQLYDQLFNVTLSNDFYIACLRGPRSIKEEKIPGRDIPYFFEVDDEPVEFDVNFALINPLTMSQIKAITRGLIARTGYKNLHFGEVSGNIYTRKTPIFNVVFTNEPDFHFMGAGKNTSNIDTYVGYFTLHVRADRPYGFEFINIRFELNGAITNSANPTTGVYTATITDLAENHTFQVGDVVIATASSPAVFGSGTATVTSVGATTINVSSTSAFTNGNITNIKLSTYTTAGPTGGTFTIPTDISIAPGISFKKTGESTNPIRLRNVANNSAVSFTSLAANERVTISASLKTITSIGGASSIYTRWDKNELILDNGSNQLVFEEYTAGNPVPWAIISSNIIENYTISLEAPSFLKGD